MTVPARSKLLDLPREVEASLQLKLVSQTLIAEPNCEGCPLKGSRKVPPEGNLNANVVILGESPGGEETIVSRPFVGKSGRILDAMLRQVDSPDVIPLEVYNAFTDSPLPLSRVISFVTNTIMCRPRTATVEGKGLLNPDQVLREAAKHCRSRLISELKIVKPKAIIALGNASLETLTGETGITRRRGAVHFSNELNTWVIPTLHPAFLLRGQERQSQFVIADIKRGFRIAREGWKDERQLFLFHPSPSEETEKVNELIIWLKHQQTRTDPLTIDVETTRQDPYNAVLKTIALSSLNDNNAISIPLPWSPESNILSVTAWNLIIPELRKLLATPQRPKIGHNLTAFDLPVLSRHGLPLSGPIYDTLVISHVLEPDVPHDLGSMVSYKLDVSPWKEVERILERKKKVTLPDLLLYNASDAQFTSKLFTKLMAEVYEDNDNTDKTLIEVETACSLLGMKMSFTGIPVCQKTRKEVGKDLKETEDRTVDLIKTKFNWPEFNPHRAVDRRELLFNKLNLPVKTYTPKTSQPSTARSVILEAAASNSIVKALLDYDIAHKLRSTFVERLAKQPDGLVHKDNRLRPSWNICGTVTARWSSSNLNCFTSDTEILTVNGWTKFDILKEGVKVAQYNPTTQEITFVKPTAYIKKDYNGDVITINNQHIRLCTTPDHRLLLGKPKSNSYETVTAEKFKFGKKIYHAGQFKFGSEHYTDDFIALLAACQADGYWTGSSWEFTVEKPRKIERLKWLKPSSHSIIDKKDNINSKIITKYKQKHRFYFTGSLAHTIHKIIGIDKSFGSWLLKWDKDSIQRFLNEIMFWDGLWIRKTNYSSCNKTNTDWVQILFTLTNKRAKIREYWSKLSTIPNWQVDVTQHQNFSWTTNAKVSKQPFTGTVYCVSVPESFIVIRKEGRAVITGQCQNIPVIMRRIFRAPAGRIFVGADASQIEFRIIAALSGCKTLIDKFNSKDSDVHSYVATQIFGDAFTSQPYKSKMWKTLRTIAKRVSYALNYGATANTIYENLKQDEELPIDVKGSLTAASVGSMQFKFFKAFPEISRWRDMIWREANKNGFLTIGPLRRKRRFGYSPIEMTVACNLPIQNWVADYMNIVFLNIDKKLPLGASIIANVHDSILVECFTEQASTVKDIVGDCMTGFCEGPEGTVILPSEPSVGETWDKV